jgi:hypothetical protein
MKNHNFCIYENKVFDLNGYEILPDENNIVTVFFNGMERRFIIDKMIAFLKDSGYHKLFRKPKELPKIKEPKPIKEKVKTVKVPRVKKPPNLCKCGVKMTSNTTCRKCYLEAIPKKKKFYKKVEFDMRTIKGRKTNGGDYGFPRRKINCSNGKTYNSLYEAAKDTGTTSSQIWHVCNGKWKHTKNLNFKYEDN